MDNNSDTGDNMNTRTITEEPKKRRGGPRGPRKHRATEEQKVLLQVAKEMGHVLGDLRKLLDAEKEVKEATKDVQDSLKAAKALARGKRAAEEDEMPRWQRWSIIAGYTLGCFGLGWGAKVGYDRYH